MDKSKFLGATGYKLRMRYLKWWLMLFVNSPDKPDEWREIGEYGPFDNEPVGEKTELGLAIANLKAQGLVDIERELGSRGK